MRATLLPACLGALVLSPWFARGLTLETDSVVVGIDDSTGALTVTEKSSGRRWGPDPWHGAAGVLEAEAGGASRVWDISKAGPVRTEKMGAARARVEFANGAKESDGPPWSLAFEIAAAADEARLTIRLERIEHPDVLKPLKLFYPHQMFSLRTEEERGAAVLPYWQGVIIPSYIFPMNGGRFCMWDDEQHSPAARGELRYYDWDGLVMPWFGIHDERSAAMAVVPYDGSIGVQWVANYNDYREVARMRHEVTTLPRILALTPVWHLPETKAGAELTCYLLPGADHTGMAKRYRRIAAERGLLVPLKKKAASNPDVEKLRGAIYTGIYGGYPHYVNMPGMAFKFENLEAILRNMHENQNVTKAFVHAWGTFANYPPSPWPISGDLGGAEALRRVVTRARSYGWLFSSYHSFVSLLEHDPAYNIALAPTDARGRPALGFRWKAVDENRWADLARAVLPREMEAIGQNADITDIAFTGRVGEGGRRLADYLASTGLVLGTERGNEWLVPKYHMFEGMVAPYRETPIARYSHPAPLFNLVYHDAIANFGKIQDPSQLAINISGDYYTKTLRAMLHGDGPMVFISPYEYEGVKPYLRFAAEHLCPLHESIAFEEMTDHAYLSRDGLVQRSKFANGVEVLVNLGPTPWTPLGGEKLPGYGFCVTRADGSLWSGRFRHSARVETMDWDF